MRTQTRRYLALPAIMIVGLAAGSMAGCDTPEQPVNPTDSTTQVRRVDEVPEGDPVVPANTSVPDNDVSDND